MASFRGFISLLRAAETKLILCGHRDVAERLHILSGIYYGTEWGRDFQVERSSARNVGFQAYLQQRYTNADDPRPCLGCGRFLSLRGSQDAGGVDMGHVLIGLNARTGFFARATNVPLHGATGLELTTWVGDLGGASARLALDRISRSNADAARYFRGTDYGARSNLEGDVAAYVVAATDAPKVGEPVIPSGGTIADALEAYFVRHRGYADRCRRFLQLQGGVFSNGTLTNRSAIERVMAEKLESFGRIYMANFLRSRGQFSVGRFLMARERTAGAAFDVAARFVDELLAW